VSVSLDPTIYPEPLRFDPERFSPSRAEHKRAEFAFVPQGHPNPHISHGCAGIEVFIVLFATFNSNWFCEHHLTHKSMWHLVQYHCFEAFCGGVGTNLLWQTRTSRGSP
jgi:hypothetical protein